MKRATIILVALVVPVILQAETRARYLMGTVCTIAGASEADIEAAFSEAARVEQLLSTWRSDSELSRVNRGEATASPELRALLDTTLAWSSRTNGAFDPRIKALVDVWRTRDEGTIPTRDAIANAKQSSAIEEGAFGKGYALDRMLARIHADRAMLDFGGQILVRGEQRVSIADPTDRGKPIVELTIANASISTSSGSEKTFVVNGRRFSHLLDPRSGEALPPRGSVSVVASDALTADILSTAIYVMGDDGPRWADANDVCAIFIDSGKSIRSSKSCDARISHMKELH